MTKIFQQAIFGRAKVAEHQSGLLRRRVPLVCRGIWLAVPETPDWATDRFLCALEWIEQNVEVIKGQEYGHALMDSLQTVFEAVLSYHAGLTGLPVAIRSEAEDSDAQRHAWMEEAWRRACKSTGGRWPDLDCRFMAADGELHTLMGAMFDEEPELPALLLIGMDSPLAQTAQPGAGHAVAAVLVCRPVLAPMPEDTDTGEQRDDAWRPFWERTPEQAATLSLLRALHVMPEIAHWHACRTITKQSERRNALTEQVNALFDELAINASLLDPEASGTGSEEDMFPDVGWVTHNVQNVATQTERFTALAVTLTGHDLDVDILHVLDKPSEYGDMGAACEVAMWAQTLARAKQLQKPVLMARFWGDHRVTMGMALPIAAAEM